MKLDEGVFNEFFDTINKLSSMLYCSKDPYNERKCDALMCFLRLYSIVMQEWDENCIVTTGHK
jgi:hypothetical protein